jgi:PPM family protein phosphatase
MAYMNVDKAIVHEEAVRAVRGVAKTDVGRCRAENQDCYGVVEDPHFRFYAVADGMGGAKGGAVASQLAIEVVTETLCSRSDIHEGHLRAAIERANLVINRNGATDPSCSGMGTTFVGLVFAGTRLYVANVGDSRAYRIREGQVLKLTEDHTVVAELLRAGVISAQQAVNNPVSHVLTRSLGPSASVEVDCWICDDPPVQGDYYLLCSDGLYNLVPEDEAAYILSTSPLDRAVELLIARANERGGYDNITAIAIQVGEDFPLEADERVTSTSTLPSHAVAAARTSEQRAPARVVPIRPATSATPERNADRRRAFCRIGVALLFLLVFTGGLLLGTANPARVLGYGSTDRLSLAGERSAPRLLAPTGAAPIESSPEELNPVVLPEGSSVRAGQEWEVVTPGAQTKGPREKLEAELREIQQLVEVETRKLAMWYGRRSRLDEVGPIALASEVAVSSPSVKRAKGNLDRTIGEYLRESEALIMRPGDPHQERRVKELAAAREKRIEELGREVRTSIQDAVSSVLKSISELSVRRDRVRADLSSMSKRD